MFGALAAFGGCDGDEPDRNTEKGGGQPPSARSLSAAWYQDPDKDGVPTHTERRIGTDPERAECVEDLGCPGLKDVGTTGLREERPSNTLLMLDSSYSMRGPADGGKRKITAARESLERFVVGTPDSTELGLLVYGHRASNAKADKAESCRGVEVLAPLGEIDYRNARRILGRFRPRGYTPIARALREARATFAAEQGERNRIVLVSDGVETCGGDAVAAARRLKRAGIAVTVDVVGFDVAKSTDAARLRRIADATAGTYTEARDANELTDFFRAEAERITAENRALTCVIRKRNELSACQIKRQNVAAADMIDEENRISADLDDRENRLSAELVDEENSANAAGDRKRAEEIAARRRRITERISARRRRITSEIARIRAAMEEKLEEERDHDERAAERRLVRVEREAAEVERRLKERYGQR